MRAGRWAAVAAVLVSLEVATTPAEIPASRPPDSQPSAQYPEISPVAASSRRSAHASSTGNANPRVYAGIVTRRSSAPTRPATPAARPSRTSRNA